MTVQYDDGNVLAYDAAGHMSPMAYRALQHAPGVAASSAPSGAALEPAVERTHADGHPGDGSHIDGSPIDGHHADGSPVDGSPIDGHHVDGNAGALPNAAELRFTDGAQARSTEGGTLSLAADGGSLLSEVVAISTASSALPSCADADQMLRAAAGLARDVIGLSAIALYIRDPSAERLLFRGSWATDADGTTRADHDTVRELTVRDGLSLQNLRETGSPALCRPRSGWFVVDHSNDARSSDAHSNDAHSSDAHSSGAGSSEIEKAEPASDDGWLMITPLFAAGHLVGMLCNEAPGGQLPEPSKQAAAAVLCGMVAIDYVARRGPVRFQPLGVATAPSQLVQRIRDAIDENPARRGKDLAVEFGVSPGHLARAFKREMGLSLVDYRNRKRIDRFWDTLRRRGRAYSLKQAAFDAGFGSYAQFNRIHKKLVGVGPRLGARRTEATLFEAHDGADAAS